MLLLVARRDSQPVGLYPDLQEVHRLDLRGIELAVPNAAARAHPLHVARTDHRAVAHGILVRQLSGQHIADDLHVAVTMGAEAHSWFYPILVDDPQRPKLHMLRIEVLGKGKTVEGPEPAVVGVAAIRTASDFVHGQPPGLPAH